MLEDNAIRLRALVAAVALACASAATASPQEEPALVGDPGDLDLDSDLVEVENEFLDLGFEDLMNVQIAAVAGTDTSWFQTPAATTVITAEDIRRSGHQSVAEMLRDAPGTNVGRIGSSLWGVSIRGFQDLFANMLQTVQDGRTLYDPLFSGTLWDVQDTLLDNIEQIEIVRGPGATLWGANAVNGVVSIRTKRASETQGLYMTALGGTFDRAAAGIRYGGTLGEHGHYRVWGRYRDIDNAVDLSGDDRPDDWNMFRGGFRADWSGDEGTEYFVTTEAYYTDRLGVGLSAPVPNAHMQSQSRRVDNRLGGGHVLFNMSHGETEPSGWSLRTYYDRTERGFGAFDVERDTFDIDFRHHFGTADDVHQLLWGIGYRYTSDETEAGDGIAFDPADRDDDLVSAFVQDTIRLGPDVSAMIGTKLEHNDYTGLEWQPSGRIWWTPDEQTTIWGAVSRPIRVPTRIEDDLRLTLAYADPSILLGGPPSGTSIPLRLDGDTHTDAEELLSFEAGWRAEFADGLVLDIATFLNFYDDMTVSPLPGTINNDADATTYGGEVAVSWRAADNWQLRGHYSFLQIQTSEELDAEEDESPRNSVGISSRLDIAEDLELNTNLYWTDRSPEYDIPAYWRLDVGLTWRFAPNWELAVWGQNLLDPEHPEAFDSFFLDAQQQIERSVYAQLTFRF